MNPLKSLQRVEIQSSIHPLQKKVCFPDAVSYSLQKILMCFFIFSPPPFHEVHEKKSQYYNTHPGHGCIPHRWCPRVASPRTWHVQPHRWRPDLHANSGMVSAGSLGDTSQVFWGGWDVPEEKQNRMNKLGMNGIKWSTPVGSLHHTLDTVTNKTTFSWKAPQTPNCLTSPSIRIVFLTWWNSFHMMDGLNYPGVFLIFHPKKKKLSPWIPSAPSRLQAPALPMLWKHLRPRPGLQFCCRVGKPLGLLRGWMEVSLQ